MNETQYGNQLHLEGEVICYTGRDVVVQTAVWAGDDAKLFAEIDDVRRESRKSDEKDNEKQRFPFMKRSRSCHKQLPSSIHV